MPNNQCRQRSDYPNEVWNVTEKIIGDVRRQGDAALVRYGEALDKVSLTVEQLRIPKKQCKKALNGLPEELKNALTTCAERIRVFNERLRPADLKWQDTFAEFSWRWIPIGRVGAYVPGGQAAYPSSVLMNAIPAKAAGSIVVVCTPPSPKPVVLAACALAGVDEVYQVGGAQAIAAMAYGTATIAAVDKIVGPGGAYVDAAKRLCAKDVAIDFPAGPTELVAVAGEDADVKQVAADLVAQAEHDARAQVGLLALDEKTAQNVRQEVMRQAAEAKRAAIAEKSIAKATFEVATPNQALEKLNTGAFEHVALYGRAAELEKDIRNAGAIYVDTPPALGDYALGSNHVLPTGGFARSAGMLSVYGFLKPVVAIRRTRKGLEEAAQRLAESEGLYAHAESLEEEKK